MTFQVPRYEWVRFLQKMRDSLEVNGKGLILMVAPHGRFHDLCHSVNPNYSQSREVTERLDELNISYTVHNVLSKYEDSNLKTFTNVINLFVIDDCYTKEEFEALSPEQLAAIHDKMNAFIAASKNNRGNYELITEEEYIVLK